MLVSCCVLIVKHDVRLPDAAAAAGDVPTHGIRPAGVQSTQEVHDQRQETAAN